MTSRDISPGQLAVAGGLSALLFPLGLAFCWRSAWSGGATLIAFGICLSAFAAGWLALLSALAMPSLGFFAAGTANLLCGSYCLRLGLARHESASVRRVLIAGLCLGEAGLYAVVLYILVLALPGHPGPAAIALTAAIACGLVSALALRAPASREPAP